MLVPDARVAGRRAARRSRSSSTSRSTTASAPSSRSAPTGASRLWSRLGNEKTRAVSRDRRGARAMGARPNGAARARRRDRGARRQRAARPDSSSCRGAFTSTDEHAVRRSARTVAFIAFDLLRDGHDRLARAAAAPSGARRSNSVFGAHRSRRCCASASRCAATAARCTSARSTQGWEGLIAKHAASLYKSGKRTPDWRKLKIVHEQEFVDRRLDRAAADARVLRRAAARRLRRRRICVYVGHTGTGFNERELARVMKLLKPLETKTCPFTTRPKTNERPHWVSPSWSRRSSSPSGPPTASCAIRCISACATTRSRQDVVRERATRASGVRSVERRTSRQRRTPARTRTDEPRSERRTSNRARRERSVASISCRALEDARKDGVLDAARTATQLKRHQPAQGVLAEAEADQGRPVPLLRRASRRSSCRRSPIGRW